MRDATFNHLIWWAVAGLLAIGIGFMVGVGVAFIAEGWK